jgi:hypothetical protein
MRRFWTRQVQWLLLTQCHLLIGDLIILLSHRCDLTHLLVALTHLPIKPTHPPIDRLRLSTDLSTPSTDRIQHSLRADRPQVHFVGSASCHESTQVSPIARTLAWSHHLTMTLEDHRYHSKTESIPSLAPLTAVDRRLSNRTNFRLSIRLYLPTANNLTTPIRVSSTNTKLLRFPRFQAHCELGRQQYSNH